MTVRVSADFAADIICACLVFMATTAVYECAENFHFHYYRMENEFMREIIFLLGKSNFHILYIFHCLNLHWPREFYQGPNNDIEEIAR